MHKMNSADNNFTEESQKLAESTKKARDAVQLSDFSTAIQATFDGLQTFSGTIQSTKMTDTEPNAS